MASRTTIATVLAYLHELYPTRDVGASTAEAWAIAFTDWEDATLETCARQAATTPGRAFFPTPGEIAGFLAVPVIDAGQVLRQISALGTYSPASGWQYPRIETVRDALGDDVASAYAAAGAERCFAGAESITQDIARRAFATELTDAQRRDPTRPLLAAPAQTLRLTAGVQHG